MDAKPQRIRVHGDENAQIALPAGKTVHQRNKSTPALSATFQSAAAKTAARRAAFGDLSNTTNQVRSNRGDAGKSQLKPSEKIALAAQEKVASVLSQPAQRPSSVKGILNTATNVKPNEASAKLVGHSQNTANTRKILKKQIFRDPLLPLIESKELTSKEISRAVGGDAAASHGPHASTTSSYDVQHKAVLLKEEVVDAQAPSCRAEEDHVVERTTSSFPRTTGIELAGQLVKKEEVTESSVTTQGTYLPAPLVQRCSTEAVPLPNAGDEHGVGPSEPDEYWDDEDDENDEDDGYTTARSYRSRGDNTTGGATTVLFPKYTQQIRRELALAKEEVEANRTAEDIEDEYWDTSMVAEYSEEIFDYIKEQEIKMLPNSHYMDNQAEIQWSMRSVLMDWLVQVHHRFNLLPETLYLCVNYIDRFLSCKIVSLGKLQLVGATAIFIAAKYEEINCPSVQEIVYMVDGGYTVDEILKAERFMLSMLQFELGWPGPMSFLRRISKADDYDLETRTLAKYFLEITIMDERFVGSPPSFAAAGAHCLARMMLKKGNWSSAHVYYSEYTYSQLLPLITLIHECCENPHKHHAAIYEKYSDKRFKRASLFVETEMKKGFILPHEGKEEPAFGRYAKFS